MNSDALSPQVAIPRHPSLPLQRVEGELGEGDEKEIKESRDSFTLPISVGPAPRPLGPGRAGAKDVGLQFSGEINSKCPLAPAPPCALYAIKKLFHFIS